LFAELEAVPLRERGENFRQQEHRLARMLDEIRMEIVWQRSR
jgi:hypothetical protein